ncbi:MAG: hypothetical protein PHI13_08760, partial [Methylococcales bacterium]|nr:hypothetical protein [Methylococcales bacterium]
LYRKKTAKTIVFNGICYHQKGYKKLFEIRQCDILLEVNSQKRFFSDTFDLQFLYELIAKCCHM